MFEILSELLGHARRLVPLMELYASRRGAGARDDATREFQQYAAELLRENRRDTMELRSVAETLQQRLKVLDEQTLALQRELARVADHQRKLMIAVVVAAVGAVGALIVAIIGLALMR